MAGVLPRSFGLGLVCLVVSAGSAADPALVWQTDYAAAMKECEKKKIPIFVVVGTDECYHCRRMEADTFRDEKVKAALIGRFVTLKIDGNKEPALVQALKVQHYPTCVLAGPDGKIHGYLQGYQSADELCTSLAQAATAIKKK